MIKLTDNLWIGNSNDELGADYYLLKIGGVLNVAQDLEGSRGWRSGIEYA